MSPARATGAVSPGELELKAEEKMMTETLDEQTSIVVPEAPTIAGLSFRGFRGEADLPGMIAVIERSRTADQDEYVETVDDLRRQYQHLVNSDPATDMLFVEMHGELIGYARVWWAQVVDGPRLYSHFAHLVPAWRKKGIRRAMLRHNERRLATIAAAHTTHTARYFEAWAAGTERDWTALLKQEGYTPIRYSFDMVRPHLNEIPEIPIPEGLDVRPVNSEDYGAVWDAAREAFRDHWGFTEEEWAETQFESWQKDETFTPDLWQVAWAGEEVAGMVLNFVSAAENRTFNRQRGYTETICVRRPWRRRGLARALIARSLRLLRDHGMNEAALGVDAENPHGALRLYESMGYQVVKRGAAYRKPLDPRGPAAKGNQPYHHP